MRKRAHSARQSLRFRKVGNCAAHVQRQLRTRPLDRVVRNATPHAAVHGAHRYYRRLLPGLPRRPAAGFKAVAVTLDKEATTLPVVVKAISHPDDARKAIDLGIDGIYCSNHGGRQSNGGLPALDTLPDIVDAADGVPVLFDSGVRNGTDAVKAPALGATAVGVGRSYAYALALGGEDGLVNYIRGVLAEADLLLMAVDGYPTIADLRAGSIRRVV